MNIIDNNIQFIFAGGAEIIKFFNDYFFIALVIGAGLPKAMQFLQEMELKNAQLKETKVRTEATISNQETLSQKTTTPRKDQDSPTNDLYS